jgi:hypothetical protein
VGARFSAPVQTGPEAHLASFTMVPGVAGDRKRPGHDADPSPPSSAEVLKQSRAIPVLSLRAFVACKKGESYLIMSTDSILYRTAVS